jgi:phage head maturation protease
VTRAPDSGASQAGEQWEDGGTRRRLTSLGLHHVALTPDPAYLDAQILAVR